MEEGDSGITGRTLVVAGRGSRTETETGGRGRLRRIAVEETSKQERTETVNRPTEPATEEEPVVVRSTSTAPKRAVSGVPRGKAAKQQAAKLVVSRTLDQLNFAAAMLVDPVAAMTLEERLMIEPPLQNYAMDNADAFLKGGEFIGPLTCVAGIVLWARRLIKADIVKLPATKKHGFGGKVERPTSTTYQDGSSMGVPTVGTTATDQPDEPTPIRGRVAESVQNGYSGLTSQLENFTRIGG